MRKTIPSFLLTLTLAGTLGLAGCGGDDSDTSGPSDETTSSSTEGEASAGGESEPAEPEAETEPAEEGDGGKPSREDVIAGYEKIITAGTTELPDDIVKKTATCFVDELYDTASAQTLQAIADENAGAIDPDDAGLFGDAGVVCAEAGAS